MYIAVQLLPFYFLGTREFIFLSAAAPPAQLPLRAALLATFFGRVIKLSFLSFWEGVPSN
jgi:hypothetical protein